MGPEILEWALGALGTTATVIGAVKSMGRCSTQSVQNEQADEEVSFTHEVARCWCGREAAYYAGAEMRYVCAKHAASAVPTSERLEPDTEPLKYCDHEQPIGQCRECYLDERYYQQQRIVVANAATVKDDEWEEPQPQQRRSQSQQAQRSVQRGAQSQLQSQRLAQPQWVQRQLVQQSLRERKGQQVQRYPRR